MDATKHKSALITGLVEKLKTGEISRSQLFEQLAVLKSSTNPHNVNPESTGDKPPPVRIITTQTETDTVTPTRTFENDSPKPNLGSPARTHHTSVMNDSLLASGDRRTLVTRLLEEKRRIRDEAILRASNDYAHERNGDITDEVVEEDRDQVNHTDTNPNNTSFGQSLSLRDLETNNDNDENSNNNNNNNNNNINNNTNGAATYTKLVAALFIEQQQQQQLHLIYSSVDVHLY